VGDEWFNRNSATVPVAARLAGGDILKIATAGKPDCFKGLRQPPNRELISF